MTSVGFIGLGHMGGVLAANLTATLTPAGHAVVEYDAAGPAKTTPGATFLESVAAVGREAGVVLLSLPDGLASGAVVAELAATGTVSLVVDTSTIGISAARANAALLAQAGAGYVDAPVSGGVAGARARTLTVMYAGSDADCAAAEPFLAGLTDKPSIRVGGAPGLAQAMKLANNFLSATSLAATSEAVAFGLAAGLDLATMLEVLNASSGASAATSDKFPRQVLTGNYAAGFANTLMAKDVRLYLSSAAELGGPCETGALMAELWSRFADAEPAADFTRVFPYLQRRADTS
jgi:3-hydroxyisobutyrate dehydrogenase-like beta-hydroxyacid dehydrogenase